jgi:hypothetical protein
LVNATDDVGAGEKFNTTGSPTPTTAPSSNVEDTRTVLVGTAGFVEDGAAEELDGAAADELP